MVIIACVIFLTLIFVAAIFLDVNDNSNTFLGLLGGIVFAANAQTTRLTTLMQAASVVVLLLVSLTL